MNSNTINLLAGVFIATGQDVASLAESASAQLIMERLSKEEMERQKPKGAGKMESICLLVTSHTHTHTRTHYYRVGCQGSYIGGRSLYESGPAQCCGGNFWWRNRTGHSEGVLALDGLLWGGE